MIYIKPNKYNMSLIGEIIDYFDVHSKYISSGIVKTLTYIWLTLKLKRQHCIWYKYIIIMIFNFINDRKSLFFKWSLYKLRFNTLYKIYENDLYL